MKTPNSQTPNPNEIQNPKPQGLPPVVPPRGTGGGNPDWDLGFGGWDFPRRDFPPTGQAVDLFPEIMNKAG